MHPGPVSNTQTMGQMLREDSLQVQTAETIFKMTCTAWLVVHFIQLAGTSCGHTDYKVGWFEREDIERMHYPIQNTINGKTLTAIKAIQKIHQAVELSGLCSSLPWLLLRPSMAKCWMICALLAFVLLSRRIWFYIYNIWRDWCDVVQTIQVNVSSRDILSILYLLSSWFNLYLYFNHHLFFQRISFLNPKIQYIEQHMYSVLSSTKNTDHPHLLSWLSRQSL